MITVIYVQNSWSGRRFTGLKGILLQALVTVSGPVMRCEYSQVCATWTVCDACLRLSGGRPTLAIGVTFAVVTVTLYNLPTRKNDKCLLFWVDYRPTPCSSTTNNIIGRVSYSTEGECSSASPSFSKTLSAVVALPCRRHSGT